MSEGIEVYKAIVAVQSALAKEGIAKDRTCTQGASYKFRGIDDVYNALAPFLAEAHLCVLPRMLTRECVERTSKQGGALFYITVSAEFDFVSAVDGSKHTVGPMYGEAMDSGDKGTNKAMSAAYKYAAFQAFCIPTEGDNDSENQTHEVKPQGQRQQGASSTAGTQSADIITENQSKMLHAKIKAMGADAAAFVEHFGIKQIELLPKAKMNDALKFIEGK
jgi:hypothetical protein